MAATPLLTKIANQYPKYISFKFLGHQQQSLPSKLQQWKRNVQCFQNSTRMLSTTKLYSPLYTIYLRIFMPSCDYMHLHRLCSRAFVQTLPQGNMFSTENIIITILDTGFSGQHIA